MKKLFITLCLTLCIGGLSWLQVRAQLPSNFTNRLQTVLDSICMKKNIKGASVAVLLPDHGIWKGTYGTSYQDNPMATDMVLGIGSNTKTFMSALILKLQELDSLHIEDTIGKWIHNQPNISGQVTIRQLLNHTSGIADYFQNSAVNDSVFGNPSKIWKKEEILTLAKAPDFAPGTSWNYSNTNYILAGMIVEAVMHQPISQVMRTLILTPQGLDHTLFYPEEELFYTKPHQWTTSLGDNGEMIDLDETPYVDNLFSLASTAGSILSTAEDIVHFWHNLVSGQIINQSSLNQMMTYVNIGTNPGNKKVGYGLGIFRYQGFINNHTIYEHGGTFFGFIHENMVDTVTGTCISVLTNQDSIGNSTLLTSLVAALHKVTLTTPLTGVEDHLYSDATIRVYPNPANDLVRIDLEKMEENMHINLMDMTGRQQLSVAVMDKSVTLNSSSLAPGAYFITLTGPDGGNLYSKKLLIAR